MRLYMPQRQMFPLIAASMSVSLGFAFFASSAAADMICPDWQYPHCGTSPATQAVCTARPNLEPPIASIVVILWPTALATGNTQERVAWPSRCTVQAPQSAMPQPYLVPVRSSTSRSTQSSGMSGSTSTWTIFPLMSSSCMSISLVGAPSMRDRPLDPQAHDDLSSTPCIRAVLSAHNRRRSGKPLIHPAQFHDNHDQHPPLRTRAARAFLVQYRSADTPVGIARASRRHGRVSGAVPQLRCGCDPPGAADIRNLRTQRRHGHRPARDVRASRCVQHGGAQGVHPGIPSEVSDRARPAEPRGADSAYDGAL